MPILQKALDAIVANGCQVCLRRDDRIQHHGQCFILHLFKRPQTNQEHHCRREHFSVLLLSPQFLAFTIFRLPICDSWAALF